MYNGEEETMCTYKQLSKINLISIKKIFYKTSKCIFKDMCIYQ